MSWEKEQEFLTKSTPSDKILSDEEIEGIRSHLDLEPRIIFLIMIQGGLRVGQVLRLRRGNIVQDQGIVSIKFIASKWRAHVTRRLNEGKITKDQYEAECKKAMERNLRDVPLLEHTAELLLAWIRMDHLEAGDYLFPARMKNRKAWVRRSKTGRRSSEWMEGVLKKAARKAGITRRITPHMCRHTFISRAKKAGLTSRQIMDYTGHASEKTLGVYSHGERAEMQKRIREINSSNRPDGNDAALVFVIEDLARAVRGEPGVPVEVKDPKQTSLSQISLDSFYHQ